MDPDLSRAARDLADARRVLVMTGAGVSTESGIPDFRSPGGIWTRFDPDDFHYERFLEDPARFWRLRAELMAALDLDRVRPNPAHEAIARAEASGRLLGVVTQNIDGLHQRAGSTVERLVEIHGSATKVTCVECGGLFPFEAARAQVEAGELPPACPTCMGTLKPGTVLFGEALPEAALARSEEWARTCDALVVAGSSLEVWPAAGLVPLAASRGARILLVNRARTGFDQEAHHVLRGDAGVLLPRLFAASGLVPAKGEPPTT